MHRVNTHGDLEDFQLEVGSADYRMRRKTKVRLLLVLTLGLFVSIIAYSHLPHYGDGDGILAVTVSMPASKNKKTQVPVEVFKSANINKVKSTPTLNAVGSKDDKIGEIIQQPRKQSAKDLKEKMEIILFMEGWVDYPEFYNSDFVMYLDYNSPAACGYKCMAYKTGERKFSTAAVVVFQPSALTIEPPTKPSGQIWVLHSFFELQEYDFRNLRKHGYENLIDYYQIRPQYVLTPQEFKIELNEIEDQGFESDMKMMKFHNRKAGLVFAQLVESCENLKPSELAAKVRTNFGNELQKLNPNNISIVPVQTCYGRPELLKLPTNVSFVILDNSTCNTVMLDQLLQVFLYESHFAVPIIPLLHDIDQLMEYREMSPPASYISMEEYDNMIKPLFAHIQQVVWQPQLFRGYLSWRSTYTLATDTGMDLIVYKYNL